MAEIHEHTGVSTWDDFRQAADTFHVAKGSERIYVFRGHPNATWRLKPTLHLSVTRESALPLPSPEELLRLETNLTARFQQEAPNYLSPAVLLSTHATLDWWTVMRHYGVPTRLLDWTASFYVAAYFATANHAQCDGTIYVLRIEELEPAMLRKYGAGADFNANKFEVEIKKPSADPILFIFGRAKALLDRMIVQQGGFMSSQNVSTDIEATLAETVPRYTSNGSDALIKIRIPASLKPEIVRRLRAMNVTAATLFPGLDGIGRTLDEITRYP
jgi:hypothetical protein